MVKKNANPDEPPEVRKTKPSAEFLAGMDEVHERDILTAIKRRSAAIFKNRLATDETRVNRPTRLENQPTLLMVTVAAHAHVFTDELLDRGADIHAKDGEDATALNYSVRAGNSYDARKLIKREALTDMTGPERAKLVMEAVEANSPECLHVLLTAGLHAKERSPTSYTAKPQTALEAARYYATHPGAREGKKTSKTQLEGHEANEACIRLLEAAEKGVILTREEAGLRAPLLRRIEEKREMRAEVSR